MMENCFQHHSSVETCGNHGCAMKDNESIGIVHESLRPNPAAI